MVNTAIFKKLCKKNPMLNRLLPAPVNGVIALLLYTVNILFWPWLIFATALLRLIPYKPWQKSCNLFLHQTPLYWTEINNHILRLTTKIEWEITGLQDLKPNDWYLLICNHQSWADILVLGYVFNRQIPPLKFFMKKELLWNLPIAGFAAALIDFPIMHRQSKSYLAKHPEKKGKDITTTREACEKFKNIPTTVITFAEGTRFTQEKHQRQSSPYQHLLRPKAGSIAFALATMGDYFHYILDVTIIYPHTQINLWDFFCGRVSKVIVHVNLIPITAELLGDYENNREYRVYFQGKMNNVWNEKDKLIQGILNSK